MARRRNGSEDTAPVIINTPSGTYSIGPGVDLSGGDLSGVDLRKANLQGAKLFKANLEGALLQEANLEGANLAHANLTGAYLYKAKLKKAYLASANFEGADLSEADLTEAYMKDAIFLDAILAEAKLTKIYAADANFNGALLNDANLEYARLWRTSFHMAKLKGADLSKAQLWETYFEGAIMKHALLRETTGSALPTCFKSADLEGTDFWGSILPKADFSGAFIRADMQKMDLRGARFNGACMGDSYFNDSDLTGASLFGADMAGVGLVDVNLTNADLTNADIFNSTLMRINMTGADLTGVDMSLSNWREVDLSGAIFPKPARYARSYGAMTGPILKIGKPDSPAKASDFKRRYPAEFERLKVDTGGKDFTESLREGLREKYKTPYEWVITDMKYRNEVQRLSSVPNEVMLLNIDLKASRYTEEDCFLLDNLARVCRHSNHPHAKYPLFTVGWIRYTRDDAHSVLLIEEVQSDVEIIRKKLKSGTEEHAQLNRAGIDTDEYARVIELLHPYSERFYEDAVGLIFQEAEALGYTVEILGYDDKKPFCYIDADGKEHCPPIWIYKELPRRLGMSQKRVSEVPTTRQLVDRVAYYKPNPSKPNYRYDLGRGRRR